MFTQKVQITLTPEEVAALSFKGNTLGYNVTKYIKFIITKEAFETVEDFPQLLMSSTLEKKTIKRDRRCLQVNYVTFETDWKVN